jgi:chemotaxis signal transduction protein
VKTSPKILGRFLWFERDNVRFAAPMECLQEVLPLPRLRVLPAAEPSLAGLMILREHVLPVFDPASLFEGAPASAASAKNVIVLTLSDRPSFALVAEKVGQVLSLPSPMPLSKAAKFPAAFSGELKSSDGPLLLILNVPGFAETMELSGASPASLAAAPTLSPQNQAMPHQFN